MGSDYNPGSRTGFTNMSGLGALLGCTTLAALTFLPQCNYSSKSSSNAARETPYHHIGKIYTVEDQDGKLVYEMIQGRGRDQNLVEEWKDMSPPSDFVMLKDLRHSEDWDGPMYTFATERGRELLRYQAIRDKLPPIGDIYCVTPKDLDEMTPTDLLDSREKYKKE